MRPKAQELVFREEALVLMSASLEFLPPSYGWELKCFINKNYYEKNTSEEAKIILSAGFVSCLWSKLILFGA